MRNEGNVRDPGRKTIIDLRWRRFGRERREREREKESSLFSFSFFVPPPFSRSCRLKPKEKLIAREMVFAIKRNRWFYGGEFSIRVRTSIVSDI